MGPFSERWELEMAGWGGSSLGVEVGEVLLLSCFKNLGSAMGGERLHQKGRRRERYAELKRDLPVARCSLLVLIPKAKAACSFVS
jgi:hypothetical protein